MGTTTIAALLGSVLATTRAGTVRALDATPHPGRLAARLLPPPASEHDGRPARLEVRTVDPAAVCAAEQTAGDDVTVVDLGAELTAAARSGLLGWADRLVFVRSDSGEAGPGQAIPGAIPVDALIAAGHKALAQDAVTVSVAHDPPATPAEPAPCLSVDGHGQAVVRIPFDAHLATGGVLDLDRLSPATAAAARQLAALVTGSSSPDLPSSAPAPDPPPPSPSSSGLPGGLTVPALVIDTPARSREQAGVVSPAGSGLAGSPPARRVRTVVVCTVVVGGPPCWRGGRRSGRGTARRCRWGVRPGTVSRRMTGTPRGPPPVWIPLRGAGRPGEQPDAADRRFPEHGPAGRRHRAAGVGAQPGARRFPAGAATAGTLPSRPAWTPRA